MPNPITIWTFDWVPEGPRGYVRDLRLRWACEEAGLPYVIKTVPSENRTASHFERQPFGQVPMIDDGEISLFESGACLIHLARKNEALMPRDAQGEAETLQWIFAALNSIEMVSMPWLFLKFAGTDDKVLNDWIDKRLDQMETVLAQRDWLVADRFTVADLAMADVLRISELRERGNHPATDAYVERITGRPAFAKALEDQLAHYAAADENRKKEPNHV